MFRSQIPLAVLSLFVLTIIPSKTAIAAEIHDLLERGDIKQAKALLVKDPRLVHAKDYMSQTPLHIAASRGYVEIVKLVLEQGADVNARANFQNTPLHVTRDPEVVKLLIQHKADLDAKGALGKTALWSAASESAGRDEIPNLPSRVIAKLLVDAGADYDIQSATCLGDAERVRALLMKNPSLAGNKQLMFYAARDGRASIVKLLLENKADPHDADFGGLPVLYLAVRHLDVMKLLVDAGADPNVPLNYRGNGSGPEGSTLLHEAVQTGSFKSAEFLISIGAKVDARDGSGVTPLHCAAWFVHPESVQLLLENHANPNARDNLDRTPLSLLSNSAEIRHRKVLELLQNHGATIDFLTAIDTGRSSRVAELLKDNPELAGSRDRTGRPALTRAVDLNDKYIVNQLLNAGAPIDGKDQVGRTALRSCTSSRHIEMAKFLIDRGANVNAQADDGSTPLHQAGFDVARLLLSAGANVNARDLHGQTPLGWSDEILGVRKTTETIDLLYKHGGRK